MGFQEKKGKKTKNRPNGILNGPISKEFDGDCWLHNVATEQRFWPDHGRAPFRAGVLPSPGGRASWPAAVAVVVVLVGLERHRLFYWDGVTLGEARSHA